MKTKVIANSIASLVYLVVFSFAVYGAISFFGENKYKKEYEAQLKANRELTKDLDSISKAYAEDKIHVLEITEEVPENEQLDEINEKLDYILNKLDE